MQTQTIMRFSREEILAALAKQYPKFDFSPDNLVSVYLGDENATPEDNAVEFEESEFLFVNMVKEDDATT